MRSLLVLLLLAAPAAAEPVAQAQLPNLVPTNPGGSADIRFDYTNYDVALFDDLTLVALNARIQYLAPSGPGGYLSVPFVYASQNDNTETEVGNLELGGLYAIRSGPQLDILLRGGVALDTASSDGELLVPLGNVLPRLGDYLTTGADSTWFRLGGQLRYAAGNLRIGGGLGFDLPTEGGDGDPDGYISLAGSIGFEQPGSFGAGLGLVMLQAFGGDDTGEDENLVGLNVMGDVALGPAARLFLALGVNLEDEVEGFSFGLGVRFGF